ncbi:hypothetical protein BDB01DRAFT_789774 [Pilobolus umbonatus]|nr:hypothetical protein BDB01DRAFT_789774 [Pilobolus umbonatus]
MPIIIPKEYGYVLGVSALSALQLMSFAMKVGAARKAAKVPYPYAYADRNEAEKDPKKNIFNCAQRAHQQSLEMYPIFQTLLLIGGLAYPEISAGCGIFYMIGRIVYVSGYISGEPGNRTKGAFGVLGLFGLLGTSALSIYNVIMN